MMRIGTDEAGKGDYFGYLVVAAVACDSEQEKKLRELNVRDSKRIVDNQVIILAKKIESICEHDIVKISPEKYNQLYSKFKNLNKLLAWAHARAIENLLKKVSGVSEVIVDKFGDPHFITDQLLEKGKKAKVVQKVHAESDIVVAAASILARAVFLLTLRSTGKQLGIVLPKGSADVKPTVEKLLEMYEPQILDVVAKKHFKITKQVMKK